MITLFVDEVPSITLSFLLARCREVPVSYYQLAKAALTMVGSGFRYERLRSPWSARDSGTRGSAHHGRLGIQVREAALKCATKNVGH